jgi:hypothetical protein
MMKTMKAPKKINLDVIFRSLLFYLFVVPREKAGKKKRPQTRQPAPMSLIACERYQAFAGQGFVDIAHGLCRQLLPHKTICKNTNKIPKNMFFSSFS